MRTIRYSLAALLVCSLLAGGQWSFAQGGPSFTKDQLDQMLAPIALYPDSLVSQVLMASTYPTEIVMADRWVKANSSLKGSAFDDALGKETWDPSVISMCKFPDVLSRMSQNLDWTTDLGNAFLANQSDVMGTVQRLRNEAYKAGNLKSTQQQKVVVEQQVIQIVPADPQVIYVPAYNPTVVYGPAWYYPSYYYPAVMVPPPGYVAGAMISFGVGFAVGAAMFGGCNWGGGNVYVNNNVFNNNNIYRNTNINNNTNINRNTNVNNNQNWQHNANNRHNVPYNNQRLYSQYNKPGQGGVNKDAARGYDRPGQGGSGTRDMNRPTGQGHTADRSVTGQKQGAFGGYGNGNLEKQSSQRGAQSRAKAGGYSKPSGGKAKASGGASHPSGGGAKGGGRKR